MYELDVESMPHILKCALILHFRYLLPPPFDLPPQSSSLLTSSSPPNSYRAAPA